MRSLYSNYSESQHDYVWWVFKLVSLVSSLPFKLWLFEAKLSLAFLLKPNLGLVWMSPASRREPGLVPAANLLILPPTTLSILPPAPLLILPLATLQKRESYETSTCPLTNSSTFFPQFFHLPPTKGRKLWSYCMFPVQTEKNSPHSFHVSYRTKYSPHLLHFQTPHSFPLKNEKHSPHSFHLHHCMFPAMKPPVVRVPCHEAPGGPMRVYYSKKTTVRVYYKLRSKVKLATFLSL